MSAIFGIVNHDGKPVEEAQLQRMSEAMEDWGPYDKKGIWTQGSVGLGCLLLHNTPESHSEHLPFQAPDGLVITAGARLDNRAELCRQLQIEPSEQSEIPDSRLILEAYRKWNLSDCLNYLLGDWAFALWDPNQQALILARDQHGNTGVYTFSNERFFAFSSSVKGLLALPEVPQQLNEVRVVERLAVWPGDGWSTFYTGIQRLPPSHYLRIREGEVQTQRFWFPEETSELRLGSDEEYLQAFLEVYAQSVRDMLRCDRPVGVTLSGGLDSGSVASLAAAELRERGERLPAFGSVPVYDTQHLIHESRFGDERPFMQATADYAGNIDLHLLRSEKINPVEGMRRSLAIHDAPTHSASNQYWMVDILETAREMGLGAVLTGQGGNATVSWRGVLPAPIARLRQGANWEEVRRDLRIYRKRFGFSPWDLLRSRLISPLLPASFKAWYKGLRQEKQSWMEHSLLKPQIIDELNLEESDREQGAQKAAMGQMDGRQLRLMMLRPDRSNIGALWMELGSAYQLEVRDPTVETRLLEFCLAIPEEMYTRRSDERLLVRRAMQGRMPEEVLWNERRGRQAADVVLRLQEKDCLEDVRAVLADLEDSPLAQRFLDMERMQQVFKAAQGEPDAKTAALVDTGLMRGLSVGMFLRRFEN
jgi:asparagine synthase (glutamine-hydrolysing)